MSLDSGFARCLRVEAVGFVFRGVQGFDWVGLPGLELNIFAHLRGTSALAAGVGALRSDLCEP